MKHSTVTPSAACWLCAPPYTLAIPCSLVFTRTINVRSDALHIGHACTKRTCTKGICDLCYVLLNHRTPETLSHILLECPFTKPVVSAVWRSIYFPLAEPHRASSVAALPTDTFIQQHKLRILFGVAQFEDPPPAHHLSTTMAAMAAVTNSYLINRRHTNASGRGPLVVSPQTAVRHITHHLCRVATALRTAAQREQTRIYTHYEGWLPDDEDKPMTKWTEAWCPLVTDAQPCVRLRRHAAPADPTPSYDLTDTAVAARFRSICNRPCQICY